MGQRKVHNFGPAGRRGFTVLEVLVAVTIFAVISVVIFSVFRSAIRSQTVAHRETKMLERARFTMDTFEKDIQNIYFRDETSYNVNMARMIEEMEMDRLRAEAQGNWENFYNKYGNPYEDEDEQDPAVGNPYERGRMIDLQVVAQEGGETDEMTFARLHSLDEGVVYRPWGLARVTYNVDNGWLMRRSESVETEQRNVLGESLGRTTRPIITRLAGGVKQFNLSFGFWYDSTWYETEVWDSSNRQIRNPDYILGAHDDEWQDMDARERDGKNLGTLQPGDEGWNEYINDLDTEPLDRLPAYIRVQIVLADPENEKRTQSYERIIRVVPSQETYSMTGHTLSEEGREIERNLRDQKYSRVFPGPVEYY